MSDIWLLTKLSLKGLFNFGNSKKSRIAIYILLAFACCSFIPMAGQASDIAKAIGAYGSDLLLQLMVIIMTILMVVMSVITNISVLFFSKDNETLMHLPLTPKSIFISRTFAAAITNYLLDLIMFVPLSIGIGIGAGVGPLFYVFMVLVALALPLLPSLICSFIILIFVRYLNVIKSKDVITYVTSIIGIGLSVVIYQVITRLFPVASEITDYNSLIESYARFVHRLIYIFPISYPLTKMIGVEISLISKIAFFLCLVGCGILLVYLIGLVADKIYFRAMLKVNSYGSKKKAIKEGKLKSSTRGRGITRALFKREMDVIMKTPIFVINFVIMGMIPLFAVIGFTITLLRTASIDELNSYKIFITSRGNAWIFLLAGVICFTNLTASIMYTKDGNTNTTMNYLPVSFQKMFVVKVFVAAFISIFTYIVALGCMQLLFHFDWYTWLFALFMGLLIIICLNFLGVFNDVNFPKTKWNSETEAAKQNIFVFVYMLEMIAFIVLGWFIKEYIIIVSIVLIAAIMIMLYKNESKYIDKLC